MITKQPKTDGYNAKYFHQHLEIAELFDHTRPYVVNRRKAFLNGKIDGILKEVTFLLEHESDLDNEEYAMLLSSDLMATALKLKLEIIRLDTPDIKGKVTDEMMETARHAPVEAVIEFTKGKALAFCHEDKVPSLTFMSKTGRAWCPACNKYYNAVDILVERDGLSFLDAVKVLNDDS